MLDQFDITKFNHMYAVTERTIRDCVRDEFDNWCCSHQNGPRQIPDWVPMDGFDDAQNAEAAVIWREMADSVMALNARDEQDADIDDPRADDEYLDGAA